MHELPLGFANAALQGIYILYRRKGCTCDPSTL